MRKHPFETLSYPTGAVWGGQGDVGSGKTAVAFLSMVMAVGNGMQAALMAPTEILAYQHYERLIVRPSALIPAPPSRLKGHAAL